MSAAAPGDRDVGAGGGRGGELPTRTISGSRRLPSTIPTRPPKKETAKDQTATAISSSGAKAAGRYSSAPWLHTRPMGERLFETGGERGRRTGVPPEEAPLAVRMRPRDLDELVGQEHLLAPGSALRVAIESGEPHSAILYGPPGTGKTTLARIVAARAEAAFEELSAVNAGRAEIRAVIERAEERRRPRGARRSSSSTRSTASTRPSRTRCCRRSRRGW